VHDKGPWAGGGKLFQDPSFLSPFLMPVVGGKQRFVKTAQRELAKLRPGVHYGMCEVLHTWWWCCEGLRQLGRKEEAYKLGVGAWAAIETAVRERPEEADCAQAMVYLSQLGSSLFRDGRPEEAEEYMQRMLNLAEELPPELKAAVKADALCTIANVYKVKSDPCMVLHYAQRAIEVREQLLACRCMHSRSESPTAHAQVRSNVVSLALAADALQGLRRYREALILQDEAIEAAEGKAAKARDNSLEQRLFLYRNKVKMLRHLGRLEEALDTCVKAAQLMRPDTPRSAASLFLAEEAMVHEAMGRLDLALDVDATRARFDDQNRYDANLVRRWAIRLVGEGRRDDAIECLRDYMSILDVEAQNLNGFLFTVENKLQIPRENLQGTIKLLQHLKNLLREGEGGEDGSLPRHTTDEIRQVRPRFQGSGPRHTRTPDCFSCSLEAGCVCVVGGEGDGPVAGAGRGGAGQGAGAGAGGAAGGAGRAAQGAGGAEEARRPQEEEARQQGQGATTATAATATPTAPAG
jgi:tetratricopeptide (TPR) repeat protein